jgi:signal transduction histidine kinase
VTDNKSKTFQIRSFISLLLLFSFLLLAFSGLMLYLRPEGSIARWTGWNILGVDKKGWEGIHIIFCILFLVIASIHLSLNWKALLHYISRRRILKKGFHRELAAAAALIVLIFTFAVLQIPPANKIMNWRSAIKDGSLLVEIQPPLPDFEKRSLQEISDFLGVSVDFILRILDAKGIKSAAPNDSLQKVADQNNRSPQDLFSLILQGIPDP